MKTVFRMTIRRADDLSFGGTYESADVRALKNAGDHAYVPASSQNRGSYHDQHDRAGLI